MAGSGRIRPVDLQPGPPWLLAEGEVGVGPDPVGGEIGQGQALPSGTLPVTGMQAIPAGRYAVKFNIAERDRQLFLAAGAAGDAAIYTDSLHAIHIIRKVIIRVGSYLNYLILKLH